MVQYEYLNMLFANKIEAEQELAKIEERKSDPVPIENADVIYATRDTKRTYLNRIINNYKEAIIEYIAQHQHQLFDKNS